MTDLRRAVLVALALFVVYNLNARAIGSIDTRVTEYLAYSLASTGRADLDDFPELHATGLIRGYLSDYDGRMRSNHPVVPALVAVPVYAGAIGAGLLPAEAPPRRSVEAIGKVTAGGATALACGVIYLLVRRRLAMRPAVAVAIAIAAGLATPFWSTASQALWSHAPGAAFLALALLADDPRIDASSRGAGWRGFAAGVMVTLAAASRPLLVCFAIGMAVSVVVRRAPHRAAAFGLGVGLVVLAVWVYDDTSAFGPAELGRSRLESAEVHQTLHDVPSARNANPLEGLAGLLVSPNRGVLIFMPVALVAALGVRRAWRDAGGDRWQVLLPTAAFVVGWSSYAVWWGGHSYGPRYAADLVVPLALMAGPALTAPTVRMASRLGRWMVLMLLAWSLGVQAIGAFGYPGGNWNGAPRDVDRAHDRLWDWRDSQIARTLGAVPYRPQPRD